MPATLDLTWKQSTYSDTPPVGKAPAIYRQDTYTHTIRVTDGKLNGFDTWTWKAQVRLKRLAAGVTVGSPLFSFTISLEVDGNDLLVHLSLTSTETTALALTAGGYWDLQLSSGPTVATWLMGRVAVLDDVSR